MKLGVSTWSLLSLDLVSAVREVGDAGFEYIELWGEVPHAYPDWTNVRKIKDLLSTYNMVLTLHAPFTDLNMASPFQPVKGAVEKTLENFVELAASLGARVVTVHPGSVHNEVMVPQSAATSVSTLNKMVRAADGRLIISVENMTKGSSKYHFPLGSTQESLELILADVDKLRFTLDTGHAHANGQVLLDLEERNKQKLVEVHLNDNGGKNDDHLVPGEGTATLDELMRSLDGTDVLTCLEINPHRYTPEEVIRSAASLKEKKALQN